MEKNPADRYQTALEMLRDIDRFKADPDVRFGYITKSKNQDSGMRTRYFRPVTENIETPPQNQQNHYRNEYTEKHNVPQNDVYSEDDVMYDTYDEDYSDLDEEETKSKSLFVPVLSAVTVVVIMVAVFFIATLVKGVFSAEGKKSSSEFAMPQLVGMDYNQAHEAYPNLDIQVDSTEYSDLEKDKIFEQSIPEGDGVKKGEIVKVKVSLGSKTIKVPNVINYHYITAGEALRAAGLEVEFQYQANDEVDEELVFDTEPAALEEVKPGSTVLVYVSKGSDVEEIEMTDFVGKQIEDAKVQCGVWGISVKTEKKDSSEAEGTILKQSIKSGEKVPADSTITFTVSTGKEPEGDVDMKFYFPGNATGRFTITAYQNGVAIYQSFTLSADYSKENLVTVRGKGTNEEITMVLTNLSNNLTAVLGKYNMNFEEGTFTAVEEDIDGAFTIVDGLYKEPEQTQATEPETEAPKSETEAPADDSSSEEGGE